MLVKTSKTLNLLLSAALMVVGMVGTAHAVKVFEKGDRSLSVSGFIQPRLELDFDRAAPVAEGAMPSDDTQLGTDFYIRRTRLIFAGKVSKKWGFKAIGLSLNSGKRGGGENYLLADSWVTYHHSKTLKVDFGLMRIPFTRHTSQNGWGIHGMDFHGMFVKRPGYSFVPTRDLGVMVRGLVLDGKLDYRISLVDGLDPGTDTRLPRLVARLAYNFFDATPEKYMAGTYLGKKKVVQISVVAALPPGVGGDSAEKDGLYALYAFDALVDLPMGENGIVFTTNVIYYGAQKNLPTVGGRTGIGFWADLGYRIGKIEPLVAVEMCMPDNEDDSSHTGECLGVRGGINWWIKGHTANLKVEYGMLKMGKGQDEGEFKKSFILQSQVRF